MYSMIFDILQNRCERVLNGSLILAYFCNVLDNLKTYKSESSRRWKLAQNCKLAEFMFSASLSTKQPKLFVVTSLVLLFKLGSWN